MNTEFYKNISASDFGKVAVVIGDCTAEREVLLNSGKAVLATLKAKGIDACGVDARSESILAELSSCDFERVFNIIHGQGAEGWGRVDIFKDHDGQLWIDELSTVPGMTVHSLVPMSAKARGINFEEIVWRIPAQLLMTGKSWSIAASGGVYVS